MSILVMSCGRDVLADVENHPQKIQAIVDYIVAFQKKEDRLVLTLPSHSSENNKSEHLDLNSVGASLVNGFERAFTKRHCSCQSVYIRKTLTIKQRNKRLTPFDIRHRIQYEDIEKQELPEIYELLTQIHQSCCVIVHGKKGMDYDDAGFSSRLAQLIRADMFIVLSRDDAIRVSHIHKCKQKQAHLRASQIKQHLDNHRFIGTDTHSMVKAALEFVKACPQSSAMITSLDHLTDISNGAGTLITYG